MMTPEMKQKLIDAGREDLVEIYEINQSGFAGVMPNTLMLVDRRLHPEAIPVQANSLMEIPAPKEVTPADVLTAELERDFPEWKWANLGESGIEGKVWAVITLDRSTALFDKLDNAEPVGHYKWDCDNNILINHK